MRYDREDLQHLLAAEFVLGNLRGGARRRMLKLTQQRPDLQRRVVSWEEPFYALLLARSPAVPPPERVWRTVRDRIAPPPDPARRTRWGWFALAGAAVLAVAVALGLWWSRPADPAMMAVLYDAEARPAVRVEWTAREAAMRRLRVTILAHPQMPADTSWQAWLLRDDGAPPLSLGLVTNEIEQELLLSEQAAAALEQARAIGISVEPKGGSPTGQPTGPFQMQGPTRRSDS